MLFAIRQLRFARVNLLMNDYAAGLPSPLAFLGYADTLARKTGCAPWSGKVLPILHDVTPSPGRLRPEYEPEGRQFAPVERVEDFTGSVEASMLIDLPGCDSASTVAGLARGLRLAGGALQNPSDVRVDAVAADGGALRSLRRGYALVPPFDPRNREIATGEEGEISDMADLLYPAEKAPGSGWLVPVAAGYRLLEDPATAPARVNLRDPRLPHVFAEPVLGIGELVSVRSSRLASLPDDAFARLFWSWSSRDGLVLGHDVYRPGYAA